MRYGRENTESAGRLASFSSSDKQVAVQSLSLLAIPRNHLFLIYKLCMTAFLNYPGNQMKHCLWKHFVTSTKLRNAESIIIVNWIHLMYYVIWLYVSWNNEALLQDLAKEKIHFWLVMHSVLATWWSALMIVILACSAAYRIKELLNVLWNLLEVENKVNMRNAGSARDLGVLSG